MRARARLLVVARGFHVRGPKKKRTAYAEPHMVFTCADPQKKWQMKAISRCRHISALLPVSWHHVVFGFADLSSFCKHYVLLWVQTSPGWVAQHRLISCSQVNRLGHCFRTGAKPSQSYRPCHCNPIWARIVREPNIYKGSSPLCPGPFLVG